MSQKRSTATPRKLRRNAANGKAELVIPTADGNPPLTLAERVYRLLKRDIIRGVLQPGEALNEKVLAARYHGSRTPVREAIMRLQQENLVRIIINKGYFVAQLTIQELNELYEFRTEVESLCAALAARRWTDEALLKKLSQEAETQYRLEDRASYMHFIEVDTEFHVGIAQLTRNRQLVRAVADSRDQQERIMFAAVGIGYYGEVPTREHQEILGAIMRREPELAANLMRSHITGSKDKVLGLASGY